MAAKEEKKADGVSTITGVYKVNLHCPQCASKIKRPLLRTQGVQSVDVDFEKSEIKVKGVIDVVKIHKLIEKLSKKKVELISPKLKSKETTAAGTEKTAAGTEKKPKEIKEPIVLTTTVRVHMHCDKCEHDLRNKLLKHKGIFSVKTDMKTQKLTVQGTIESDKILSYLRKKVHKHAEIVTNSIPENKKEEKKEKEKAEVNSAESSSTKIKEFREEVKVEVKSKEGNDPYFIHYVYAPQLFSDENPNACFIM